MEPPAPVNKRPLSMAQKMQSSQANKGNLAKKSTKAKLQTFATEKQEEKLAKIESLVETVKVVRLEGLALLKIIRHCDTAVVDSVSGTLCGVANKSTLEITDSYRFPNNIDDVAYQKDMLRTLGALGADNYNVGWYRCAFYSEYLDRDIALQSFKFQTEIPFSVLLVYDPIATRHGRLAVQAFRLKDKITQQLKENSTIGCEAIVSQRITTNEIFEEIPIVFHNHPLIHGFLFELRQERAININCASLAMHNEDDVVDMMSRLAESIERFRNEQNQFKNHVKDLRSWTNRRDEYVKNNQRQRFRNQSEEQLREEFELKQPKPPDKDRLDSVLSTTLMNSLSSEMLEVVNNDFFRIWVTKGI